MSNDYSDMVAAFNAASGAHYNANVHFLKFRRTSRGVLVGWWAAKPEEVADLCRAVRTAGRPYYAKYNGRIIKSEEAADA